MPSIQGTVGGADWSAAHVCAAPYGGAGCPHASCARARGGGVRTEQKTYLLRCVLLKAPRGPVISWT